MAENRRDQIEKDGRALVQKLEAVAWGGFFIWIGRAFLANLGWGMGLLGVDVITLGAQAARKYFGLPVEWFWLVIGFVFVLWGVWELLNIQRGPPPILFLVVGIAFVVSALVRKPGR